MLVEALDKATRLSVVYADCTEAAGELARAHLSGPCASAYLAQSLACVSLLGVETAQADETVTFKFTVPGPLGGLLVECTEKGTLRGYTNKKVIDEFDGLSFKDKDILGANATAEIIRSLPGKIISSGAVALANPSVAQALEDYFAQSLQRRVKVAAVGAAGDDGVPYFARAVMVECAPDGDEEAFANVDVNACKKYLSSATCSVRTLLKKLNLPHAEIRNERELKFACRCSPERAQAMLATIPEAERATLPSTLDITCHMCGRIFTVPAR